MNHQSIPRMIFRMRLEIMPYETASGKRQCNAMSILRLNLKQNKVCYSLSIWLNKMHSSAIARSSRINLRRRVGPLSASFRRSSSHLQNQIQNQKAWSKPTRRYFDVGVGFYYRALSTIANKGDGRGDDIYQQALQFMKEANDLDSEREQERSTMMYEAWQKSQGKEINSKSQGVTVVKTLVKSVRKARSKNDDASDKRNEAMVLLKDAANKYNHPEAAIQLGNILLKEASRSINANANIKTNNHGGSDPKDLVNKAIALFRQAGEAGSRVGWYNLGNLMWTGFPPPMDSKGESEEEGTNTAGYEMKDNQIVVSDMDSAMKAFNKAIDLGDSDAMYLVGVNRLGQGDNQSYRDGIHLIKRAADAGHAGALYYLALLVRIHTLVHSTSAELQWHKR